MLLPKAECGPQRSRRKAGSEAQATHPWPGWGQGGSQEKRTRGDVWGVGGRKAGALVLLDSLREASGLLSALFSEWPTQGLAKDEEDLWSRGCSAPHSHPTPPHPLPLVVMSGTLSAVSAQFSRSVVSDSEISWTATRQASLSVTNSQSLLKLMSIESVMLSNHLILCHPLLCVSCVGKSKRKFHALSGSQ